VKLGLTLDEGLTTTRAVRKRLDFDRPVEHTVLEECLRIAIQAPTAINEQRWQWIFVTDATKRRELADVYSSNYRAQRHHSVTSKFPDGDVRTERHAHLVEAVDHLSDNMHRVPVMLIPCIEGELEGLPLVQAASTWGSILPAVWSFMLAARERGLGTAWTTVHLVDDGHKKVARLLGIPDGYTQTGLVPIAYTLGTDFRPAKRLPVESIVHWNAWGQSSARR
jgi:nitroreductase